MTLRNWNSFQYGSTGWTLSSVTRTAGTGQSGYASLRSTAGVDGNATFGIASATEVIFGFCFKHTNVRDQKFLELNGPGGANSPDLALRCESDGSIALWRGNYSTELGRSTSGLLDNSIENYIEARCLAGAGTGEFEVRLNGDPTSVLDLPGISTQLTAVTEVILIGDPSGTRDFSAFYYVEVDATAPNDFLGHIRFGVLEASANGNSSQLVGSDGNQVDNYLLVDDPAITPDDDTTYVYSATAGEKDTYGMTNLPTTPLSIIAVCPLIRAKKTDAGSRAVVPVIRSGGTDYDGATEHFLSTSYSNYKQAFLEDPDTSSPWDEAGINAMELGVKVST
jgi:hypothetical protein